MSATDLDRLDAQMATTIERLDDRIAEAAVPPLDATRPTPVGPAHPQRPPVGRWLAAAALVAVVAGAVVLLAARDDEGAVADADDPAAMVLSAERASEFDDISAHEIREGAGAEPDAGEAWLHAPAGDEFPWPDVLIETVVRAELLPDEGASVRDGRLVDLGGVDGYVDARDGTVRVRWFTADGDVHAIGSTTITYDELEEVARSFVDSGRGPGTMPGFEALAESEPWAFAEVSGYVGRGAPPTPAMSGVLYNAFLAEPVGLTVTTISGDAADWRISTAEWSDADLVTVRGDRPGFSGVTDDGPLPTGSIRWLSVSWMQGDQTFVVATLLTADGEPDRLLSLVDDLEALDEADWDAFLAEHGVEADVD